MKNIFFYLVFFIAICVGIFYITLRSSTEKENEEILFNEIDIAAVENVTADTEQMSIAESPPKRVYSEPKSTAKINHVLKKSVFTTKNMTHNQYVAFNARENKINIKLMSEAYNLVLDENGDGKVDSSLKEPHDKAVRDALESQKKILEEIQAEVAKGLLDKNVASLLSETIDRALYSYYYSKYGFDPKKDDFPTGQRQKMVEERVRNLPEDINRTTEHIRNKVFKSIPPSSQ